ncbi:MAG: hypothetical protein PHN47_03495 [Clostridia bacterium]|jgi:hypothetical protein|nr:hypothetical protein [Clostridia bacterium]MDD4571530.1 hypothetical protein [Clostridia bacterium]
MKRAKQEKIWQKAEKILGFAAVLGMVFIIAVQVIFATDIFNEQFNYSGGINGTALDTTLPVVYDDTELFGNLTIEITGYNTLPEALVLINGSPAGNFKEKQVTIRVYAGDVVEVDASAYERFISFAVVKASGNINVEYLREKLTVNGSKAKVGEVLFK